MSDLPAMVNKKRLIRNLQKLISIDSQNPPGDESAIARYVGKYFKDLGLDVREYEFEKKRVNLIATLKGKESRKKLLLSPHLDTVPAGISWKYPAFSGKITAGKIYGLGATDCKGNLASGMEAIHSLVENRTRLNYDLVFAATADEESGSSLGLIPLLKKRILHADAALILDADDFEIVITQKGLMHLKVRIKGKKAHGAYPWLGSNAIDTAAKIILDLKKVTKTSLSNKYLHGPTVNVGTIKGGDKVNVVSDWCEFELDFRFLPGQSHETILKNLKNTILRYTKNYKIEINGIQNPYYIEPQHPLVSSLALAMRKLKINPRISGSEGATVITFFKERNIPAIATGFGNEGCAQMADEYAKVGSLYKGALVLEEFLKGEKLWNR